MINHLKTIGVMSLVFGSIAGFVVFPKVFIVLSTAIALVLFYISIYSTFEVRK